VSSTSGAGYRLPLWNDPDNRLALSAVDGDGLLWSRAQSAVNGSYTGWRQVGDVGNLHTVGYDSAETSFTWTALGGGDLTGSPVVVTYPGYRLQVSAHSAARGIVTEEQTSSGSWTGDWQSTGTFDAAGSPAAILDSVLGRVAVVARGPGNEIFRTWETSQGSGTWGTWQKVIDATDPAASDPTIATVTNSTGPTFFVVLRGTNVVVRIYERGLVGGSSALSARKQQAVPAFPARTLPKAPKS
jgi:hypothetical protein